MERQVWTTARSRAALLMCWVALLPLAGCTTVASLVYVIKGTNVDAQYTGLKGKRVAVVCRPTAALQYGRTSVAKDLAKQVAYLLRDNVRKIDIVNPEKVNEWMDENTWDEYAEVGEAFDAQLVVAIDLEEFSLFQGRRVPGTRVVSLNVYDLEQEDRVVFSRNPPQFLYPPNTGVPIGPRRNSEASLSRPRPWTSRGCLRPRLACTLPAARRFNSEPPSCTWRAGRRVRRSDEYPARFTWRRPKVAGVGRESLAQFVGHGLGTRWSKGPAGSASGRLAGGAARFL